LDIFFLDISAASEITFCWQFFCLQAIYLLDKMCLSSIFPGFYDYMTKNADWHIF